MIERDYSETKQEFNSIDYRSISTKKLEYLLKKSSRLIDKSESVKRKGYIKSRITYIHNRLLTEYKSRFL